MKTPSGENMLAMKADQNYRAKEIFGDHLIGSDR